MLDDDFEVIPYETALFEQGVKYERKKFTEPGCRVGKYLHE